MRHMLFMALAGLTAGPLLGLGLFGQVATAASLTLTTEEYPPFNFVNPAETNAVSGITTDVVREIMRRTGTGHTIHLLPWQRAYNAALQQPDHCVFSTTITDERLPLFKWVGPIVDNDWVMYAKAGSPLELASLDEARGRTVGGYTGDAVALYLADQGFTLSLVKNDRLNARMIEAGRIDLWASGSKLAPYLAKSEGTSGLKPLFTFRQTQLGLACHLAVDDAVIDELQAALDAVKADGTLAAIEAKYR